MSYDRSAAQFDIEKKSMIVAYILWFFLGYIGAHRFYLGHGLSGLIMLALTAVIFILTLVSFGLFGFLWFIMGAWWIIDALLIPFLAQDTNTQIADRIFSRR